MSNELRNRIAKVIDQALAHWDEHGDDELVDTEYSAQAVIDDFGLTVVHAPAWDGEPKMGGGSHRMSVGTEHQYRRNVENLIETWKHRSDKPGLRIESRVVGRWEITEGAMNDEQ